MRIIALIPLLLCSCTQTLAFTKADLQSARAVAGKIDPAGAACWRALLPAFPETQVNGIATIIERDRLFELAMQGPNAPCVPVAGQIASELVKRSKMLGVFGL